MLSSKANKIVYNFWRDGNNEKQSVKNGIVLCSYIIEKKGIKRSEKTEYLNIRDELRDILSKFK